MYIPKTDMYTKWVVSKMKLNRAILQDLANIRFDEVKLLLDNGKYDGAYYLSGYVIETALKACFAKNVEQYDFPDKTTVTKHLFVHTLSSLLGTASLTPAFNEEIKITPQLDVNWTEVVKWNEESRYEKHSKEKAERMFDAISSPNGGVFLWLKKHW